MERELVVEEIGVDGTTVSITYSATGGLDRFFDSNSFWVEYNVDVEDVPNEILYIPFLTNAAPVCWATGADIRIPSIDSRFAESLVEVKRSFSDLYPMLSKSSTIHTSRTTISSGQSSNSSGMLFSGGVDSLTTFVRHKEEKPKLFLAQGIDIGHEQRAAWDRTLTFAERFAEYYDTDVHTIRTNCYTFLSRQMLSAHFGDEITDNSWWSGVQHGMGLLGLCAPLSYKLELSDLYIGSTHTESFQRPWGSHPKVDNRVYWSGSQCHHDAYDLTRQEKVQMIASHSESNHPDLKIRSCFNSRNGGNCGECEKCCRTIIGLDIAGVNPSEYGFPVVLDEEFYQHVRSGFEEGRWKLGHDELYMWTDLQNHISDDMTEQPNARGGFYKWFKNLNLSECRKVTSTSKKRRLLWWLARNMPKPVFDLSYPVYKRIS